MTKGEVYSEEGSYVSTEFNYDHSLRDLHSYELVLDDHIHFGVDRGCQSKEDGPMKRITLKRESFELNKR